MGWWALPFHVKMTLIRIYSENRRVYKSESRGTPRFKRLVEEKQKKKKKSDILSEDRKEESKENFVSLELSKGEFLEFLERINKLCEKLMRSSDIYFKIT